jgi:transcriptional regulator with XRE-family HTH domain
VRRDTWKSLARLPRRHYKAPLQEGAPTAVSSQLGQRIRVLREKLFLTQEQVAERAKISVSYLSTIENAQRTPYLETLLAISNALGITVSQLFAGLNAPRADIGQAPDLPLMAYLGTLRLDRKELDALLKVCKSHVRQSAVG